MSAAGRVLETTAPAKVNLGLRVGPRRADGYHQIESVFAPLDLADRLQLRVREAPEPEVALSLHDAAPDVPADERNLAVRAARAFLQAAGLALRVEIDLVKRIPSGAGLGGGSSDAGAVLRLLAEAHPGALAAGALAELALGLGADVPWFLDPRPARVGGVGERIAPLAGLPRLTLLLVNPGTALPTAEVYRALDALRAPEPGGRSDAGHSGSSSDAPAPPDWTGADLAAQLRNDLEPAAVRLCPEIRRLRERLLALGPRAVALSGSGPTLYAVFAGPEEARRAGRDFGAPVWTRVASTLESG